MENRTLDKVIVSNTSFVFICVLIRMILWWGDIAVLDPVSMKMNTAVGIFLLNLYFNLSYFHFNNRLIKVIPITAFIVGYLSFLDNLSSIESISISRILISDNSAANFHLMSLGTSISICLFSLALWLLFSKSTLNNRIGIHLVYAVGFNSLLVIIGYIFNLQQENYPGYLLTESPFTASMFLLMLVNISFAFPEVGIPHILLKSNLTSSILRIGFVFGIILSILIGSIILSLYRHSYFSAEFGYVAFITTMIGMLIFILFIFGENLTRAYEKEKRLNKVILSSIHKLNLATKTANLGIWELDLKSNSIEWNDVMHQLYAVDEYNGSVEVFRSFVHTDDLVSTDKAFSEVVQGTSINGILFRIIDGKGKLKYIYSSASPSYNDNNEIEKIIGVNLDFTEIELSKIQIENALEKNKVLMSEMNHRTKNNFHLINSILMIKARTVEGETKEFIDKISDMIRTFATIHEQLIEPKHPGKISIKEYLNLLCKKLISTYANGLKYELHLDIIDEEFDFKIVNTLGIIANEILTNVMKYAYPDSNGGPINVYLGKKSKSYELVISDQGVGIDLQVLESKFKSHGIQLIHLFVQQLSGEMDIKSDKGTTYTITFKAEL